MTSSFPAETIQISPRYTCLSSTSASLPATWSDQNGFINHNLSITFLSDLLMVSALKSCRLSTSLYWVMWEGFCLHL